MVILKVICFTKIKISKINRPNNINIYLEQLVRQTFIILFNYLSKI